MQRQLGELVGEPRGLNQRLVAADQSRSFMHAHMDQQDGLLGGLKHQVGRLDDRVKSAESKIDMVVERVEGYERDGKRAWSIVSFAGSRLGQALRWALIACAAALWAFWREIIALLRGG